MSCTYLLPIRRPIFDPAEAEAFRCYFGSIEASVSEILVIDGSPPDVFAAHHNIWSQMCRHEPVDRAFGFLNDKVNGIHTGVRLTDTEKIILADDDIRYTSNQIEEMSQLLDRFEVVRPQNYFALDAAPRLRRDRVGQISNSPNGVLGKLETRPILPDHIRFAPWALTEAARMLINRATLRTADYPGTCAFHRPLMLRDRNYDGDVLFDNEELIRHLVRGGARIFYANDFFVKKRPPTFRKWLEQRPRQAYEDFGLRFKTILFASLLPLAIISAAVTSKWLFVFLLPILIAFAGWLRGNARKYFPLHVCLFAPLWVVERSLSTYWAFYWWLTRGGYPFGERLLTRGIGRDWIEGGRIAAKIVAHSEPNNE